LTPIATFGNAGREKSRFGNLFLPTVAKRHLQGMANIGFDPAQNPGKPDLEHVILIPQFCKTISIQTSSYEQNIK
jgi:hypothetical protein